MTSETNGTSAPDPSGPDGEADLAAGDPVADTVPAPVQGGPGKREVDEGNDQGGDREGRAAAATQGLPLLFSDVLRPPGGEPASEPVTPKHAAPVSSAPVSTAPVSSAPVSTAPVSSAPVSTASESSAPVSTAADAGASAAAADPAAEPPGAAPATPEPGAWSGRAVYHTSAVYGGKPDPRPAKRRTLVVSAIAGVLALLLVAIVLTVTVFKSSAEVAPPHGIIPTGGSTVADGDQVATAFLDAWRSGDLAKAANYTDDPAAAEAALQAYARDLNLKRFAASAGTVTGASGSTAAKPRETVAFAVSASVAAGTAQGAVRGTWQYQSSLVAYQKANSSVWFVAWQPDVVAPNLTSSTHLAAVKVSPTVSMVTDAGGANLTNYKDPGLDTIAGLLATQAPASEGANAGLDVEIETASGKPVANSQAVIIAPGNYPTLSTTISATAETAARKAVSTHTGSAMVAIQPSTGKILAIANNAGYNDFALTASVAPGSTMKVITSTALFTSGLATADSSVQCPATVTVQGVTYHNDAGETEPAGTPLYYDFAQSCNNAFDQWWPHLYGKLASTAKKYYGLDQNWNIGIGDLSASYFNAPADASGSELAEEAFGEGKLSASPLAMASVAATVDTGTFKQPILTTTAKQLTATPLPASTDAGLKKEMRAVVTEGTAAGLGLGANVYAKTGTADIVGQQQPNSWLIAFDPAKDIAVACLVVNAGYGSQYAGPETASFLKAY